MSPSPWWLANYVIEAQVPLPPASCLTSTGFFGAPVLAVMEVPHESISSYGFIDAEPVEDNGSSDRVYRIRSKHGGENLRCRTRRQIWRSSAVTS